jgi:protein TonB
VLHGVAVGVWVLLPKNTLIDIPVRAINLKLGSGEIANDKAEEVAQRPEPQVPSNPKPQKAPPPIAKEEDPYAKIDAEIERYYNQPRQYVRATGDVSSTLKGQSDFNVAGADVKSRYTQLISQWIQKFKEYPTQAKQNRIEGKAIARIRIDRKGNIRVFAIEQSTGSTLLDYAVTDMIERASPVPPVPAAYGGGHFLEFLIPVEFSLR